MKIDLVELKSSDSSNLLVTVFESLKFDHGDFTRVERTRWLLDKSERRCLFGIDSLIRVNWGYNVGWIRAISDALEDCILSDGLCLSWWFRVQDAINERVNADHSSL